MNILKESRPQIEAELREALGDYDKMVSLEAKARALQTPCPPGSLESEVSKAAQESRIAGVLIFIYLWTLISISGIVELFC